VDVGHDPLHKLVARGRAVLPQLPVEITLETKLEEKTNTVEVALHRALDRLRGVLDGPGPPSGAERL